MPIMLAAAALAAIGTPALYYLQGFTLLCVFILAFWCVFVVNPAIFEDFNNIYFMRIYSKPCIVLVYRLLMAVMVDFTELFRF